MASHADSQARKVFQSVRDTLVYKDEDVLETGMQKVQPLQYLDEEIYRHRDQISDSVSGAERHHDGVPSRLLSQVNQVIETAGRGKTTLYKASALLEFTSEAFQYARQASQDTFDLSRNCQKKLAQSDSVFTEMMEARLNTQIEQAEECQDKCVVCLECAVDEAEKDLTSCKRRSQEEDGLERRTGNLEELKCEVRDSIRDEMSELMMIKENCSSDLRNIASGVSEFREGVEREVTERSKRRESWTNKLHANRQEQEALRRRLKDLQDDEQHLEMDLGRLKEEEGHAQLVRDDTHRLMEEWQRKIEDLQSRVLTSIKIMTDMKEITDTIVQDAIEKQASVKDKLIRCELEGLLANRDALLAHGVVCMMIMSDCDANIKINNSEITNKESERKLAARTMNAAKINSAKSAIREYEEMNGKYKSTYTEFEGKLQTTHHKLEEVEERLKRLKPSLKLDRMQDRFEERKQLMDQVFEKESVSGIIFKSTKSHRL